MAKIGGKIFLVLLLVTVAVLSVNNQIPTRLSDIKIKVSSLPIKFVRVEGIFQHLKREELQEVLMPLVSTGFLEADMPTIQKVVGDLPWVKTVAIKRIWPDTINIKVEEKIPFVRWGENSLVTEQGIIFTPKDINEFSQLMIVSGPKDQQLKTLEIMKGVTTALSDQSISLTEFHINERWSWKIKLTTGLEILLGRDEQLKKLQRFLKTLSVLTPEQIQAMAVVDLRYPNGYAVSWKPDTPEIDWTGSANPNHPVEAEKQ